ncbi:MAG: hypothetical protein Q9209_007526 [Squamulea sp. 1 TL-2023]
MARILKDTHIDKVVAFAIDNERNGTSQQAYCYIQESYLSKNDRHIISQYGISAVEDPAGFDHITNTTLVYMQAAYPDMYRIISEGPSWPAVLICDRLDRHVSAVDNGGLVPKDLRKPGVNYSMGINREEAVKIEQMAGNDDGGGAGSAP